MNVAAVGATVGVLLAQPVSVSAGAVSPVADSAAVRTPIEVAREKVPVRGTAAVGENATITAQLDDAARDAVHVVEVKLKSVPVTDVAVGTVNTAATLPVFVMVTVAEPVDPTCVDEKPETLRSSAAPVPWTLLA